MPDRAADGKFFRKPASCAQSRLEETAGQTQDLSWTGQSPCLQNDRIYQMQFTILHPLILSSRVTTDAPR